MISTKITLKKIIFVKNAFCKVVWIASAFQVVLNAMKKTIIFLLKDYAKIVFLLDAKDVKIWILVQNVLHNYFCKMANANPALLKDVRNVVADKYVKNVILLKIIL